VGVVRRHYYAARRRRVLSSAVLGNTKERHRPILEATRSLGIKKKASEPLGASRRRRRRRSHRV
jgi:hypothetical protein